MQAVERHHPHVPHWYLAVLGTDPPRQGCGVGSSLLEPVLARCDAEGVPAALSTYTSTAVRWFQRAGFAVTHATRTAVDHELPVWTMVRRPRRTA
jgi:GNAT superfamily N-acetyltransferase